MNLKYLQTFLILCEQKSFTRTAEQLHVAQSVVTTQIQQLEELLQVRLFERSGRTVLVTSAGEALIPYARQMLQLKDDMLQLSHAAGFLTVGTTEDAADCLIGDILREWKSRHPDDTVFLKIISGKDAASMLSSGELDAALVLDHPIHARSVTVPCSRPEKPALIVPPTHPLAGKHGLTSSDLAGMPLLLPPPGNPYRRVLEESFYRAGIRPTIALESVSSSVIKESSLCGLGIGLLPESAVQKELIYHIVEKLNYRLDYQVCTQLLIPADKWQSDLFKDFLDTAIRHLHG